MSKKACRMRDLHDMRSGCSRACPAAATCRYLCTMGAALLLSSCLNSPDKEGVARLERGDYAGAYQILNDLSTRNPGNTVIYEHRQTAARLEYRRRMALARDALLKSDLSTFLVHVTAAGDIKPDSTAAELARLVRAARERGHDDQRIVREMVQALQSEGMAVNAAMGFGILADGLSDSVSAGRVPQPVSVLPFAGPDIPPTEALVYRNRLIEELTRRGVQVVDRSLMDRILEEHKFQRSDLVDPTTCVEVGKLLGAASFVTADLTRDGANVRVQLRAVNVATAQAAWSASALVLPAP